MNIHYKAIIFDLDGTAIPNKKDGMPSPHLLRIIKKLKDKTFICVATGRRIHECRHIFKALGLTSPCIILGGTQIVDPVTEKILWQKLIPKETVEEVINTAKQFKYDMLISQETVESSPSDKVITGPENVIYIMTINKENCDFLLEKLGSIEDIAAHPVPSYTKNFVDVHITHKEATKKHALERLFEMLQVKKEEVVGFGDGNNDLPIFEMVGYKVAMSNGSQQLKDMADLIAPAAEEDGVAKIIEKLVFSPDSLV